MRKFLTYFGVFVLVLLAIGVFGIGRSFYRAYALDSAAQAYLEAAIPAIVTHWDSNALLERATREFRDAVPSGDLSARFHAFAELGPMVDYLGAVREGFSTFLGTNGTAYQADYLVSATFRNGTATLRVALIERNGMWRINGFFVDPIIDSEPVREI